MQCGTQRPRVLGCYKIRCGFQEHTKNGCLEMVKGIFRFLKIQNKGIGKNTEKIFQNSDLHSPKT